MMTISDADRDDALRRLQADAMTLDASTILELGLVARALRYAAQEREQGGDPSHGQRFADTLVDLAAAELNRMAARTEAAGMGGA